MSDLVTVEPSATQPTDVTVHAALTGTSAHSATTTNTASRGVVRDASGNILVGTVNGVTLEAAIAGTGAGVGLPEPTGGGASVVTLRAPALAGNATVMLPATTRDLGADGTKLDGIAAGATAPIALLGAATSVTTTPYTVLAADAYLRCTASASVIALEAAPATGRTIAIKNKTASDLTFSGSTIDGSAAHTVSPDACRWLRWNGTDYDAI